MKTHAMHFVVFGYVTNSSKNHLLLCSSIGNFKYGELVFNNTLSKYNESLNLLATILKVFFLGIWIQNLGFLYWMNLLVQEILATCYVKTCTIDLTCPGQMPEILNTQC